MSIRLLRSCAAASMVIVSAACSEGAPTSVLSDEIIASAAELDRQAARAGGIGDSGSASAFRGGAEALRHGVQPTEIEIFVGGEMTRYKAVVAAEAIRLEGDSLLRRTLIAWNSSDRPLALLRVTTLGNQGSFSGEATPAADPRGRAHGNWVNFVRDSRWTATSGDAAIHVNSTGEHCAVPAAAPTSAPPRPAGPPRCVKAEFRVGVDGLFMVNGDGVDAGLPGVRIRTEAASVNGYIVGGGGGSGRGLARPTGRG